MNFSQPNIESTSYIPKEINDEDYFIFFGSKNIVIFLRFFYTIYERLLKAKDICKTIKQNKKTTNLSENEIK